MYLSLIVIFPGSQAAQAEVKVLNKGLVYFQGANGKGFQIIERRVYSAEIINCNRYWHWRTAIVIKQYGSLK